LKVIFYIVGAATAAAIMRRAYGRRGKRQSGEHSFRSHLCRGPWPELAQYCAGCYCLLPLQQRTFRKSLNGEFRAQAFVFFAAVFNRINFNLNITN
jgi:hypothetical protein